MSDKPVVNVTGSTCPIASDREFNKWYNQVHIPVNMKFKGLTGVTRYQLVKSSDWALEKEYPRYLTLYKFNDMKAFERWNVSPELSAASEGVPELMARLGVKMIWRAQYEFIKAWEKTLPLSVITIMGSDCSPEGEAKYDRWYSESHIPHLLEFKDLSGVERYRLEGKTHMGVKNVGGLTAKSSRFPKFLTLYFFADKAAADAYDVSPERTKEIANSQKMIEEAKIQQVWRAQYEPMRTWAQGCPK